MLTGGRSYAGSESLHEYTFVALCQGLVDLSPIEIMFLASLLFREHPNPRLQEHKQSVTQIVTLLTEIYDP